MKLMEAAELSALRERVKPSMPRKTVKTAEELAQAIWAEAEGRGIHGSLGGCSTWQEWQRRWLPSREFRLVRLPLNAAALACAPRETNLVLKKIHAREETPILVDYNQNQIGAAMHGFVPQVVVIDGKHRFQSATLRGDSHIMAWVGEEAISELRAGASGGTGGGPDPASTTPAAGAKLVARGKKVGQMDVKKMEAACKADMKAGKFQFKPDMKAKAPPGCESMVQKLKDKFGEDSSSPFKIAWHAHNKGNC